MREPGRQPGPAQGNPGTGAGGAQVPAMVQGDPIDDAANSTDENRRLEGRAAQALREAGMNIVSFNKSFGPNGSLGETDIETDTTIIEVTTAPARKGRQLDRLLGDTRMNPDRKAVLLYAPNYGRAAEQVVLDKGAHVVRTAPQLVELVRRLGG